MKIAIASDDRVNIADHFGRTRGFLIFNIDGNKIENKLYIENSFTGHAQGHHHDQGHEHQHTHGGILDALKDCQVVISRGMGRRLFEDFNRVGKEVFITPVVDAQEAVDQYMRGNLVHDPDKSCQH